ncbi:hypothetical protein KC358_g17 [Hortaea werneckii]|nr:hypothetical protein KC358_g17 [Hortaea werneckii]
MNRLVNRRRLLRAVVGSTVGVASHQRRALFDRTIARIVVQAIFDGFQLNLIVPPVDEIAVKAKAKGFRPHGTGLTPSQQDWKAICARMLLTHRVGTSEAYSVCHRPSGILIWNPLGKGTMDFVSPPTPRPRAGRIVDLLALPTKVIDASSLYDTAVNTKEGIYCCHKRKRKSRLEGVKRRHPDRKWARNQG